MRSAAASVSSSSALGRRRARSLEASVASFVTLALPPLSAVQGCMCFAAASDSSSSALGRRRARSLEASVASFHTLAYPPLCAEDQDVLGRLGMRQVQLIFPTEEEWRNPALLLRRAYAEPGST